MSGEGTAASVAGEVLRRARASSGCPRATLGLPARGGAAAAGRGGAGATTTPAAARAAFRRLALALHPDKAKGAPGAEEAFKVANTALGRLLRELQRGEWDAARVARAAAGAEAGDRAAGGGGGGVSEAAVRAAREAWGGGRAPRTGPTQAPPVPASRRAAKAAGETRGPRRRSGAGFTGRQCDEAAFSFSFASGADDDDFHRRPPRRTSAGRCSEDAGQCPETEGSFQYRVSARFPLRDQGAGARNKAAGESEVSAARAVWGKKKPRLDVYSATRGVALGSRAQQGPAPITEPPNGEPNAAPELQGGTCALRDEKPGEATARNTAAAILRRASKQVFLAKGRHGKGKRKSKAGKQADNDPVKPKPKPSGEGAAPDKGKRARKGKRKEAHPRKVSRTRNLDGLAPARAVKRPTLLEQLGVTITSKE